jgi:hypothetical protein
MERATAKEIMISWAKMAGCPLVSSLRILRAQAPQMADKGRSACPYLRREFLVGGAL